MEFGNIMCQFRCSLLSTLINVANSEKLFLLDVLGQLKDKKYVIEGMTYSTFSILKDTKSELITTIGHSFFLSFNLRHPVENASCNRKRSLLMDYDPDNSFVR